MRFDHLVKHNGVAYPAGADVPVETTSEEGQHKESKPVKGKTTK